MAENNCSVCGAPAVIRLHDGRRLCRDHFITDAGTRVFENIKSSGMIKSGDNVLAGLSGGKDSTALVLLLSEYVKQNPDVKLTVITIDEGISGYREDTIEAARRLIDFVNADGKRADWHILTFTELFGDTLDNLVFGKETNACSICGVLRRRALETAAKKYGCSVIATGHNLDDEAQSVLMNLLRGDEPSLLLNTAAGYPGEFASRVKPLSVLTEKEICTYLILLDFFTLLPECPYAVNALRMEARAMIADLEPDIPLIRENLMKFRTDLRRLVPSSPKGELRKCRVCGEMTSGDVCRVCRLLGRG